MTRIHEGHPDIAVTVTALTAEAAALRSRVTELRQELVDVNDRMTALSTLLHRDARGARGPSPARVRSRP
ncbi:hypothetical protein [Streptomyces sp. NPDC088350]|uniref:hypothetical protein n=1 Tax=Streptomyces sp. NPDC088350 TaxID=3365854 RepID=UPI00382AA65B